MKETNKTNNNDGLIPDGVFTSIYDMLKFAEAAGYTAREFASWAKAKGYSPKMVISMTQSYIECYQRLGTKDK
jgi:hypothetical protein